MWTLVAAILAGAVALVALWIVTGTINRIWFKRLFKDEDIGQQVDLLVILGPLGTFVLALMAGLQGFCNLCKSLACAWEK